MRVAKADEYRKSIMRSFRENAKRCVLKSHPGLLVEVVDLTVIMSRCWCINLYDGDVKSSCSQADRYQSVDDWSAS